MRHDMFGRRTSESEAPDNLSGPRLDEFCGDTDDQWSRSASHEKPHDAGPPANSRGPDATGHPPGIVAADPANRRAGPRHHLIYRVASLVDDQREMLCVVRDISEGGLCVQIFGEIDLPRMLKIALANDRQFVVEKAWQANGRSGFRFLEPIETGEFLSPRHIYPNKRGLRLRTDMAVFATARQLDIPARLIDISVKGAKLEFADQLPPLDQTIDLRIPDLGAKHAEIRWLEARTAGVKFNAEIGFDALAEWSAARWIENAPVAADGFRLARRRA